MHFIRNLYPTAVSRTVLSYWHAGQPCVKRGFEQGWEESKWVRWASAEPGARGAKKNRELKYCVWPHPRLTLVSIATLQP